MNKGIIVFFSNMNDLELATKSLELIRKDLGIEENFDVPSQEPFDWLKQRLSLYIREMLNKDFGRLIIIFYRLDIGEVNVRQILEQADPDQIPTLLAGAIIEREKQKVITREKYR
ncbi:MAG: hypothetical protein KI790_02925 [Cyclobacteriaceae bacterium]|nr:hypothetical protein [Cyclobacteriaceae bacterium HetDA_MAG_MS6]